MALLNEKALNVEHCKYFRMVYPNFLNNIFVVYVQKVNFCSFSTEIH